MRLKNKSLDKTAVAIVLCFSVVALASVFTVKSSIDKIQLGMDDKVNISSPEKSQMKDQAASKKVPTVDSENNSSNSGSLKPAYISPVKGTLLCDFSSDNPVYSKTLDQYMVHEGVDIGVPIGTKVVSAAQGTVSKVYDDDRYGRSVLINHGNSICSVYSNLSVDDIVEEGDVVAQGETIGIVGETALFELLDESHLHFEMRNGEKQINPNIHIKK